MIPAIVYPVLWTFFCVLARIGPLLAMMPPLRTGQVPRRVSVLILLAIAASLTPLAIARAEPMPTSLLAMAISVAAEAVLGLLLGGVVTLIFFAVTSSGQVLGALASLDLAEISDPATRAPSSLLSQIVNWLAMAIFVAVGGHRQMIATCVDSFGRYPAGGVRLEEFWLLHEVTLLQHSCELGLRLAAPAAVALLLANLLTALLGRTLPQLNIMAVGFNLNILVLLTVFVTTIGAIGWMFEESLVQWLESAEGLWISS